MAVCWLAIRELFAVRRKLIGQAMLVAVGVLLFASIDFIARSRESAIVQELERMGPQLRLIPKESGYSRDRQSNDLGPFISKADRRKIGNTVTNNRGNSKSLLEIRKTGEGIGRIVGIEPSAKGLLSTRGLQAGHILLGQGLAEKLAKSEGDKISLVGQSWRIQRVLPTQGAQEDFTALMRLDNLQRATGLDGKVNEIHISGLSPDKRNDLIAALQNQFPQLQVLKTSVRDSPAEHDSGQALSQHRRLISRFALLAIALSLAAAAYINIGERRQEIAALRVLGGTAFTVFAVVALRCLIIGFLGATLGLLMGAGVAIALDPMATLRMSWPWAQSLSVLGATMAVSFTASLPASLVAFLRNDLEILQE